MTRSEANLAREVGARLTMLRGMRTQRQWAIELGIVQSRLQRYEAGQSVPRADALIAIASNTGHSIDWILTGQGKRLRGALRSVR